MLNEPLAARLQALGSDLARLGSLGPEARVAAQALRAELERLSAGTPVAAPSASSLEALAIRFDAEHPAMSAALRQVADLLGKAGI